MDMSNKSWIRSDESIRSHKNTKSPFGDCHPPSLRVLSRWGITPEQAAYVGDTPADVLAAHTAGLLPVGAAWAQTSLLRPHPAAQESITSCDLDRFIDWIRERVTLQQG